MADKPKNRSKAQLNYAWQWFSYHATQRTNMLNYFLVGIGILANAYVAAVTAKFTLVATSIAILGAVVSFSFFMLEVRNRSLVGYAQDVLRRLERDYLFASEDGQKAPDEGILSADDARAGRLPALNAVLNGHHKVYIPLIEIAATIAFIGAAIWTLVTR
jgi:hypothetical protein